MNQPNAGSPDHSAILG